MASDVTFDIIARDRASSTFSKVGNSAETSSGKISRFGSLAGKAGLAIAAGLGAAAVASVTFGVKAVGAASDLNETMSKSNVIFGKNAVAVQKWAGGAAKTMGLSKQAALEAASGFGDMFTQIGYTGDQATKMSKKVTQLAVDFGSFNNLPTADVLDMISGAFRGEYDSLQRVIPNISAARVQTLALTQTGKKHAEQLTAQEKATATLAIIQKDGSRAAGDFARTSGGLANQQKILAAQFENVQASIGQKLLPVAVKVMTWANDDFFPAVQRLSAALQAHLGPALAAVGGFIQTRVVPAAQMLFHWFVDKIAPGLKSAVLPIINSLRGTLDRLKAKVEENRPQLEKLGNAFRVVAEFIANKVAPILGKLAGYWLTYVGRQIETTITIIAALVDAFIWTERHVEELGRAFGQFAVTVRDKIATAVSFVKGLPGKIQGAVAGASTWLVHTGQAIIGGLLAGINTGIQWVMDKINALGNLIPGWLKKRLGIASPSKVTTKIGEQILEGLVKGIENKWQPLTSVLDKLTGYIDQKSQKIADLMGKRSDIISSFGGFTSSVFGATNTDKQGNEVSPTVASLLTFQKKEKYKAQHLKRDTAKLLKMGLSSDLIQQMAASGEAGLEQIHALAGGSRSQIKQLNSLNASTNAALTAAGTMAGNDLYGSDIKDAKRDKALAQEIAKALVAEERKHPKEEIRIRLEGPGGKELVYQINKYQHGQGKAIPFP